MLVICATLVIAGCAKAVEDAPKEAPPSPQAARIGAVVRVWGDDASSSAANVATAIASARARGAEVQVLESRTRDDDVERLNLLAAQGYNPIVALGEETAPALTYVAGNYPKTQFASLGGAVDAPNVDSVLVADARPAFLAGVLAALASRDHRVGVIESIGPARQAAFERGVRAGARFADPSAAVSFGGPGGAGAVIVAQAGDEGARAAQALSPAVARIAYGAAGKGAAAYFPDPLVIAAVITTQQALAEKMPSGVSFVGLEEGFAPTLTASGSARLGPAGVKRYRDAYSKVVNHELAP